MSRAIAFVAAVEAEILRTGDEISMLQLVELATALTDPDRREIGDIFARRLAANDTFAIEQVLLNFAHEDTLPAIAQAARARVEAGSNDDSVLRLLASHAPAVLKPHREWLAQQDIHVVADRDLRDTAAVGPAIHIVTPLGHADIHCGVPTPTWLPSYGRRLGSARFGGELAATCGICGGRLHRLLELGELPPRFQLSVDRLTIASCLSCLGWENDELWFRHGGDGSVSMLDDTGQYYDPQFPAGPLTPATAELVDFGARYAKQSWGTSMFENLNRLGGAPSWVQDEIILECRECAAPMRHLMQVDSDFPLADSGRKFLFGSGGIAYVQWCDTCRLSVQFWQCT